MDIKDIFTYLAFQVGLIYTLTRLMQDAGYSYMSFYLTDYLKLPTVSYRDDNVTGLHCCAVVGPGSAWSGISQNFPASLYSEYETHSLLQSVHYEVESRINSPGFSSVKPTQFAAS